MSSPCPEPPDYRRGGAGGGVSRRACLRWAVAAVAAPAMARAACPCDDDDGPAQDVNTPPATRPAALLRVCADPGNLPFSNRERQGFEDKIIELIARDLGLSLQYEWLPQRLGFFRQALKTGDADLVMAAPAGFERALVTRPYYRSSYVFVSRRRAGGTPIRSFDDPALRQARIGVQLTGGSNTPPTHALAKRNLIDNVTGYPVFDERAGKPGESIIAAVASGEIDVAVAWGPQAGYFARGQQAPLEVTPVSPETDRIGDVSLDFTFDICIALRRADKDLRDRINSVIACRQAEIGRILDGFNVPRLPFRPARRGTGFGEDRVDGKHD